MDHKNKTSLFRYLAMSTLWNGVYSSSFQYCLLILPNLQCITWLLTYMFQTLMDSDDTHISLSVWKLTNILILKADLQQISSESMLVFSHILTWLYFFLISILLVFITNCYLKDQELSQKAKFIILLTFQFHLIWGFVFTTETLFEPLVKTTNLPAALKTQEWVITASNIVLLTASYLLGCFAALFSYDPFVSTNVLSCHDQNFQVFTFLFKAIIIPFLYLIRVTDHLSWLIIAASLSILVIRHYYLVTSCPYYNYSTMKLALLLSSICVSVAFIVTISAIVNQYTTLTANGMLYMQIILAIIVAIFTNCNFERKMLAYITFPNKPLRTETDIFEKFLSIQYLSKGLTFPLTPDTPLERKELYFWGIYLDTMKNAEAYNHPDIESLALNNDPKMRADILKQLENEFNKHYMQNFLKEVEKRKGKSNKATCLLISLLLDSIKTLPACIIYFSRLSKLNFLDHIIISKLHRKMLRNIRTVFHEKEASQGLNIKSYIDEEVLSKEFIDALHLKASQYIKFWNSYNEKNVKVRSLYIKSVQLEKQHDKIQMLWKNSIESAKYLTRSMVPAYSLYLSIIRNRPVSAAKLIEEWQSKPSFSERTGVEAFISQEDLASLNHLIFQVSLSKDRIGQISSVSPQIVQVLGWSQKDILRRNINTVLPQFVREPHNRLLEGYLTKITKYSSLTRINQVLGSFVVNKEGFVSPCEIYLSIHPYIQDELIFISIVKVKDVKGGLILLNKDGFIEGSNEFISNRFGLSQERKVHIRDICENYGELESMMSSFSSKEKAKEVEKMHSYSARPVSLIEEAEDTREFSLCLKSLKAEGSIAFEEFESTRLYRQHMSDTKFFVLHLNQYIGKKSHQVEYETTDIIDLDIPNEISLDEEATPYVGDNLLRKTQDNQDSYGLLKLNGQTFYSTNNFSSPASKTRGKTDVEKFKSQNIPSSPSRSDTAEEKAFVDIFEETKRESGSANEKLNMQMEQALEVNLKDRKFSYLKLAGIIFIIMIPLTLVWLQVDIDKVSSMLISNIEIISQTALLLSKTVELNRMARLIVTSDLGLVNPAKYKVADAKTVMTGPILEYCSVINHLNNGIKTAFDNIDRELLTVAYSYKIPIHEKDNVTGTRYSNIFGFLTELTMEGIKVGKTPIDKLNRSNLDIQFILNNTLNDFILAGEEIRPIMISDAEIKMKKQEDLVFPILLVMSCCGFFILLTLFKLLSQFIKKRDRLLSGLFRLNQKTLDSHVKKVHKFAKALEKGYFSSRGNVKIERSVFKRQTVNVENPNLTRKSVNMEGANMTFIKCSLCLVLLVILLLLIYPIHLIMLKSQRATALSKMNLMVESDNYLYHFILLSGLFYEYIQENGTTTVRNYPIKQEMDLLFADLTNAQNFFGNTLLQSDSHFTSDATLSSLVKGNLCSIFDISASIQSLCVSDKGGMLTKGVIGMNSIILTILQAAIASFEASPRAFSDMYAAINNPDTYSLEYIQYYYLYQTYSAINKIIKIELENDLKDFERIYGTLNLLFSCASLLVGLVCWHYAIKTFEEEMTQWMNVIRQIPWKVLMGNKLLKGYLIKRSQTHLK